MKKTKKFILDKMNSKSEQNRTNRETGATMTSSAPDLKSALCPVMAHAKLKIEDMIDKHGMIFCSIMYENDFSGLR